MRAIPCGPRGCPQWIEARKVQGLTGELSVTATAPFFPLGLAKFVVMSFGTFGLYEIYWFYKQWTTIKKRTGDDLMPIPRAIFVIFFFHELVKEVNETGRERGFLAPLNVGGLTALFIVLTITWRLPSVLGLIAFLAIIPLLFVQNRMNEINEQAAPLADRNQRIRGWNWLALFLGLPFFLFAVWLTFTEPS